MSWGKYTPTFVGEVPTRSGRMAQIRAFPGVSCLPGPPRSQDVQNVPVCSGPGPGRWVRGPCPGLSSEDLGLAGGLSFLLSSLLPGPPLGQPLAYPVLLCAQVSHLMLSGMGGAPHTAQMPRSRALSLLSWVTRRFNSFRSGVWFLFCSYARRASF